MKLNSIHHFFPSKRVQLLSGHYPFFPLLNTSSYESYFYNSAKPVHPHHLFYQRSLLPLNISQCYPYTLTNITSCNEYYTTCAAVPGFKIIQEIKNTTLSVRHLPPLG